jgi:uncharacterized protein YyaL (SSP411 family)
MEKVGPPNRLIHETSPYLRQHAHNPVDWYPWGPEALARSESEQKPIFLSIGYSACHWCHVMEHESFEDPQTANLMNSLFVNIKVDREERPDLDHIYMSAVQMMTQHGGWPMSVFLTPELRPFYGGTYFPPHDRMGMPSFQNILTGVANAWQTRRDEVLQSANQISQSLIELNDKPPGVTSAEPTLNLVENAIRKFETNFDFENGGFGSSPKFFHEMDLRVCLRRAKGAFSETALAMVTTTLDKISRGGIYDHLGGGFHRYSTDERWLAPHFEKMLYDNALLSELFLEAFQLTKKKEYLQIAGETLDYVLREMTSPEGGFYSTQDADSEGVEGKFYVWSEEEICRELGEHAAPFSQIYDVSASGNWEGANILNLTHAPDPWPAKKNFTACREKLLRVRGQRIAPARDEKVLVSWNALMIQSMALGYQVSKDSRYLEAAKNAAQFILTQMVNRTDGSFKLQHVYKDGHARLPAYLDDYAHLIQALATLYETDFDPLWLTEARGLCDRMVDQFWDAEGKVFYFTAKDHEKLIIRPKEVYDGATPSGTSSAVTALIHLGKLIGRPDLVSIAEQVISQHVGLISNAPAAVGQMIIAMISLLDNPVEIVISGGTNLEKQRVIDYVHSEFLPNKVLLKLPDQKELRHDLLSAHFDGKVADAEKVTAFICRNFACDAPVVGADKIQTALSKL